MAPRKSDEERLEELLKKKEQLKNQIQAKEAKLRKKDRARDTRRKVVMGGMVFAHMEHDPEFKAMIWGLAERLVTRRLDREVLDLPPRIEGKSNEGHHSGDTAKD